MSGMRNQKATRNCMALLVLGVGMLLAPSLFAQEGSSEASDYRRSYYFQNFVYPGDTFLQLLSINDEGLVAGYHGSGATGHPNKGILLTPAGTFISENFPDSAQTQVTGINDARVTVGFYINSEGTTFGFYKDTKGYHRVAYPGTTFNQLLGTNQIGQFAGYYADSAGNDHGYTFAPWADLFQLLTFVSTSVVSVQETGINDSGEICGFYVNGDGVNYGFTLAGGTFTTLKYPDSTFTQALGINDRGEVVGDYMDSAGLTHGFVYLHGHFQSVDDPEGIGTTTVNGLNRVGQLVGFYVDTEGNTDGFVATP